MVGAAWFHLPMLNAFLSNVGGEGSSGISRIYTSGGMLQSQLDGNGSDFLPLQNWLIVVQPVLLVLDLGQTDLQLDQLNGRLSVLRDSLLPLEILQLL